MPFVPISDDLTTLRTPLGLDPEPGPRRLDLPESPLAAAWRTQNIVGSILAAGKPAGTPRVPGYTAADDPQFKGTVYEQDHSDYFVGSDSPAETTARMRQVDRELKDLRNIEDAGWTGTIANVAMGVADPTIFIPGGQLVRSARGGYSLVRTFASGGSAVAAGVAIQEGTLLATQATRDPRESAVTIGAATILAGLFGGAAAKWATAAERSAGISALETIRSELRSTTGLTQPAGATAADVRTLHPRTMVPDVVSRAYRGARSGLERMGDLPVVGPIAGPVGKAASKMLAIPEALIKRSGPLTRMAYSSSIAGKRAAFDLVESPIEFVDNEIGIPTSMRGPAVETTARIAVDGARYKLGQELDRLFSQYYFGKQVPLSKSRAALARFQGERERLSYREFKQAVATALMNGDVHEVPAVEAAAKFVRSEIFDPWKEAAIRAGLLPADVSTKTAESYFTRLYDKEKIIARRPEFTKIVTDWLEGDQATKAQIKADLQRNRDLRAERLKLARKLDRRLETVERRQTELEGRLAERDMEARRVANRVGVLEERTASLNDEIADLEEFIGDALDNIRDPALKAEIQELQTVLKGLKEGDRPITEVDLARIEADEVGGILVGPLRKAARIAIGKVKSPKVPSFGAWIAANGGVKDTGGDVLHSLGDRLTFPGIISSTGKSLDQWGEQLRGEFSGVFRERPSPDEVLAMIEASARGEQPHWFVEAKMKPGDLVAMESATLIQRLADDAGVELTSIDDVVDLFRNTEPRTLDELEAEVNAMPESMAMLERANVEDRIRIRRETVRSLRDDIEQARHLKGRAVVREGKENARLAEAQANLRYNVGDGFREPEAEYGPRDLGIPESASRPVASFRNTTKLKAHPDYAAAKAGDIEAGARLVEAVVSPVSIAEAKSRFAPGAIFAYPNAVEASGRNKIPAALADLYADETGGTASAGIVQANRVFHTGAGAMERLVRRPVFDGPIQPGGRYVLVDDVSTMGGTLAEMAAYIRRGGGEVEGVVLLVNATRFDVLLPKPEVIAGLKEKFGDIIRQELGVNPSALTAPEAGYLSRFRDADTLRNSIAAARGRSRSRVSPPASPRSQGSDEEGGLAEGGADDLQGVPPPSRGRMGILNDRAERLDLQADLLSRARQNIERELDDLRLKAEEHIQRWEGRSVSEAQAALKARAEQERLRALKQDAGIYEGKGERLAGADRAVDRAIKRIVASDRDKSRDELLDLAEQITDRILGSPDGRLPYDIASGGPRVGPPSDGPPRRGPLAVRQFMIPDQLIADFLNRDVEQVAHSYLGSIVPDVLIAERFGDTDMTEAFRQINEEYAARVRGADDEAERVALRNEQERVIGDLAAMRDRLRGTYAYSSDTVMRNAGRIAGALGSLNTLTDMGGSAIAQITDFAGPVWRYGFGSVFRNGYMPFVNGLMGAEGFKEAMQQYRAMGIAVDMHFNTRNLDEVGEQYHPRTKGERTLRGAAQGFMVANLSSPMTDAAKSIAAVVSGSEILQATKALAEGSATQKQITSLAAASIDEPMATRIWNSFQESGIVKDGVHIPNTGDWSDAGARTSFEGAVSREANIAVVTPGQEKALWLSNPVLKILGQFKAFIASSTVRIMAANLQRRDAQTLQGLIGSIALGMLGYRAYTAVSGQEASDRWQDWVKEGVNRAGVLGWLDEGNSFVSKFTRGRLDAYRLVGADRPLSRYASRGVLGALLGPTGGKIENLAQAVGALAAGEFTGSDTRAARRLLPLQNLWYIRRLLNEVEDGFNDAMGIPARAG